MAQVEDSPPMHIHGKSRTTAVSGRLEAVATAALSATLLLACSSDEGGAGDTVAGAGGALGAGGAMAPGGLPGAGGATASGGALGSGGIGAGGLDPGDPPGAGGGFATGGTPGAGGAPGAGGGIGGADSGFDACVAALTPVCRTREMDTSAKMEAASCKATEFIPIPLTGGGNYGPITVEGGPYGGKIDWNEGAGTPFVNPVHPSEPLCLPTLIDAFAEPASVTADLKNTRNIDYSLYTIFRPACMKEGETYPVITWANGTCGLTHGYAILLSTLSSHGFVIIASNSTWTNTAPTNTVQTRALDYAAAVNDDPSSPLHGKLDLANIGAMGHSQGAAATLAADADARIKSVILWNSGNSSRKPFLNVSGDRDIGNPTAATLRTGANAASQPGAWVFHHQVLQTGGNFTGHLVLMEQPDRVWEMTVGWWAWQLKGDQTAKAMFIGDGCRLCGRDAEFEYGHNTLLQ